MSEIEETNNYNNPEVKKDHFSTSDSSLTSDIKNAHKSDISFSPSYSFAPNPSNLTYKAPKLTNKNRGFIEHLIAGKSTLEAYRLAGYKGSSHAAYQLRSQLKEQLKQLLEAEGLDRNGLKIRVKTMLDMNIDPEVKHLSPKMYLETLKFADKLMEHEKETDIKISPFIVNTTNATIQATTGNH